MAKDNIDHKDIDARSHPAARLFPMMTDKELSELAEDIKENGQLEPISLYGDLILDGRNRAAVCKMLGIQPNTVRIETDSPVHFVISKNLHRRHLTISQQGMIAAEMVPFLKEEARERQISYLKQNQKDGPLVPNGTDGGRATEAAAKAFDVSRNTVERAVVVKKHDPELAEKVKAGEVKVNTAYEQVRESQRKERQPTAREIQLDMAMLLGDVGDAVRNLTEYVDATRAASARPPAELKGWVKETKKLAKELTKFAMKLDKELPGTIDQNHEVEQRRDSAATA